MCAGHLLKLLRDFMEQVSCHASTIFLLHSNKLDLREVRSKGRETAIFVAEAHTEVLKAQASFH